MVFPLQWAYRTLETHNKRSYCCGKLGSAVEMNISITGLDELRKRIDPAWFQAVLERGLKAAVIHLEGKVKERTPVRTGRLRASITHGGKGLRYTVGTDVKYARFVEEGTKPHVIRPRTKKALAWSGGGRTAAGLGRGPQGTKKRGGQLIVRKRVNHPGTKGTQMFERAGQESFADLTRIVQNQVARALER